MKKKFFLFVYSSLALLVNAQQTTNYIPKWNGTSYVNTVTPIFEDATNLQIGIGTTTPGSILELKTTTPIISFNINQNFYGAVIGARIFGGATSSAWNASYFSFQTHGTNTSSYTDDLVVKGGYIGIGTISPGQRLEIYHNDVSGGLVFNRANATASKSEIKFSRQGVEKWAIGNDLGENGTQNFFIWDHAATATRFFIDPSGNIGVNSTTPSAQLYVSGATNSTAFSAYTYHNGDYGYGLTLAVDGLTATNRSRTKAIALLDNVGADQFIVWGDGFVHAREVKVQLGTFTGHSDYVFADNYELLSLDDLKKFIQKNKHLPGVPSNADVKKNKGINLGEMAEANLAKTEELYLYVLQLSDEVKNLKEENKKLIAEIETLKKK